MSGEHYHREAPCDCEPQPDELLDFEGMKKALAYVAAEVGETVLDDAAWTLIRRAVGLNEVTASSREVLAALGFGWHEAAAWRHTGIVPIEEGQP